MSYFGLYCSIGIGDIVFVHNILENEKHKYDQLCVNPMWSFIGSWRNGVENYRIFVNDLISLLFTDKKYRIDVGGLFNHISVPQLIHDHRMKITKPNLDVLCNETINITEPYVVVTTKVRELNIKYYTNIRNYFINSLKKISEKYKIVVIGEREVEMNTEYVVHTTANVYSVYQDLVNIPNIIDLTIPKLGITPPDMSKVKYDCSLMKNAVAVITLGIGGNFVLASGSARRMISFCYDPYDFVFSLFTGLPQYNVSFNWEIFINGLNGL